LKKFFILLTFLSVLVGQNLFAQTPEYSAFVKKADSLYRAKDYKKSAMTYHAAFNTMEGKGYREDRYNAACSWALAGYPDSAFFNLQRIVDKLKYAEYDHLSNDTDLASLHSDPRWKPLLKQVKQNDEAGKGSDKALYHLLDSMKTEDQKWRNKLVQYWNGELGTDSAVFNSVTHNITLTDSLNYFLLIDIFAKHGYPNYDLVGERGSSNFWLLVQHQDRHPSFQDSVLTKMKIEVDSGKASGENYAYLVDRVKVNTGQPQVYGTQMQLNSKSTSYEPKNVIEPEKLNERRKSVGLTSIEDYIQFMNHRHFGSLKKK
jgi:hypothetical protein